MMISSIQEVKDALIRIFHQKQRGYDTAVRSKALSMLFDAGLSQEELLEVMEESADPWNTEYDSYIQARLNNLAESDGNIKYVVLSVYYCNVHICNFVPI
jgi:hypothetical protein